MQHTSKITRSKDPLFLITQPGDEIDYYSIILQVPRHRESAFIRASRKTGFSAAAFGTVIYYAAGQLSPDAARSIASAILSPSS